MPKTMQQWLFSPLVVVALAWPMAAAAQQVCRSETEVPSSTPTSRFTDHGNGTVTDAHTGLMWAKCTAGLSGAACGQGALTVVTWQGALDFAASSSLAGYEDWRLPNVNELRSIVEQRCWRPTINQDAAVFPNTPSLSFWSSSPSALSSLNAWIVEFHDGNSNDPHRGSSARVRLVRAGP